MFDKPTIIEIFSILLFLERRISYNINESNMLCLYRLQRKLYRPQLTFFAPDDFGKTHAGLKIMPPAHGAA